MSRAHCAAVRMNVSESGQPVAPLGSCTVSVLFLPRTAGKRMDLLRLGSGQACDPFPPVTLTGTGN